MLLSCLLLLGGCIQLEPNDETSETETDPSGPDGENKHYYQDAVYVYATDVDQNLLLTDFDPVYMQLVNKVSAAGKNFVPASLTVLTCPTYTGKTVELETRAANALYEMLDEMRAAGVDDIMVTSGYRSYSYQVSLNNHYINQESSGFSENAYRHFGEDYIQKNYLDRGLTALSAKDVEAVVRSYSAAPGESEHQTGLCVDFITSVMSGLDTTFEDTEAFEWLSKNAYKFGFILRYPKGKEGITGYTYEPWHYRFVGREAATDIYFGGTTLEGYLGTAR